MSPLTENEIKALLPRVPGWERRGTEIRRTWSFPDFRAAIAFVNRVTDLAEAANHHPDIDVRYSKVTLVLSTHDAGGLTARDFALAEKIGA
ncbi:MAG TPA: 4a-hydroxytetrahydrobiopterin dehydratase [Vicinamibacteria bacterium]|nr:4a-hydroxytetrahydrobiopterin dehydratase [Vicinamibacteria bacterium]